MSKSNIKEYFVPPFVLVIICLVVTASLALTYQMTSPIIAENAEKTKIEAVQAVLPDGENFEEKEGTVDGVSTYFVSSNNEGIAVMATEKSFGGPMDVMVGIDSNGAIVSVKIVSHIDTPGLGDKPMAEEEISQYNGLSQLTGTGTKDSNEIDGVTGATVSSDAIFRATQKALEQWAAL